MSDLQRFTFHVADDADDGPRPAFRGFRADAVGADVDSGFTNDEAAARFHLTRVFETDDRPAVRGVSAPSRPQLVPDLELVDTQRLPGTNTNLVRFQQRQDDIPIFGGQAVCELDDDRSLVSASGRVGEVEGVSSQASLSPAEAVASIARVAEVDRAQLGDIGSGKLNFFQDDRRRWHLVYVFERVPAAPPGAVAEVRGHGLRGRSPRTLRPLFDYLVDAHDGEVVLSFSHTPLLDAPPPVPTKITGQAEDGQVVTFWGTTVGDTFVLSDPLRGVETHDHGFGDIDSGQVEGPYESTVNNLGAEQKALVSAHVNATRVCQFYKSVLQRDGIDNKGMALVNIVNCTYAADEVPPNWHNAVWYDGRMWYGQVTDGNGGFVSFSRLLDVIGHELTHGVTESTANLVYQGQSGALNESFSDIFGVAINNWDFRDPPADGGDVSGWRWEIGSGLGDNGLPLRDMSDPARTGDPAHMDDYLQTVGDAGGVHTNSNIHNKAAFNLFTAVDAAGAPVFTPADVALMYYLALTRLGRLDGFEATRDAVVNVAMTLYRGDAAERDAKLGAIRGAYAAVGIA